MPPLLVATPARENTDSPSPRPKASRNQVVDMVKGFAIILVVLGHVEQGLAHRHLFGGPAYSIPENFIYMFHMPAFFFVAGLFLDQSLAKRGSRVFAMEKFRTLLYPYLLWPLMALPFLPILLRYEMPRHQSTPAYLLTICMGDAGWFLFTLFFALMLAVLLRRLPLWSRFLIAVPLSMFWSFLPGHHGIDGIFWNYVFVVAGQFVGSKIELLDRVPKWAAALGSLALFGILWAIAVPTAAQGTPETVAIPLGLAGTAGLFLLSASLPWPWMTRSIAWVGEASLGIYLMSPFAQGFSRLILLNKLHVTAPLPEIVFQTVFTTLVTAWIYQKRRVLHIEALFRMPGGRTAKAGAPPGNVPVEATV